MPRLIVLATALLLLRAEGAPAAWERPVDGEVARAFAITPGDRFAAGQHRGVTFAARAGVAVRAACTGRVVFAGAVGRAGRTLTVACGRWTASYQGVAGVSVRRGALVAAGVVVARAGGAGRVYLSARRTGTRSGYVNPLTLMAAPGRPPPLVPGAGPSPTRRPPRQPVVAVRTPPPVHAPAPARVPARPGVPFGAWLGLTAVLTAIPVGGVVRVRRRRTRVAALSR